MPTNSHLSALFASRPIILVVEDRVAEEYLYAAWGVDRQYFAIVAAGGHQTVTGVVTEARKHGYANVFGTRDRDFGNDNLAQWPAPQDHMYTCPRHEMENYLLDWPALAGCALNSMHSHSLAQIQTKANEEAQKQPWWLACRKRLRWMQSHHGDGFPKAPKIPHITGYQEAFEYITQCVWFGDLQNRTTAILDQADLQQELHAGHTQYTNDLNNGDWVQTFSGKEVFRQLRSHIYGVPKTVSPEPDVDLAKSVGQWQYDNNAVPQDIVDLKNALKTCVGV